MDVRRMGVPPDARMALAADSRAQRSEIERATLGLDGSVVFGDCIGSGASLRPHFTLMSPSSVKMPSIKVSLQSECTGLYIPTYGFHLICVVRYTKWGNHILFRPEFAWLRKTLIEPNRNHRTSEYDDGIRKEGRQKSGLALGIVREPPTFPMPPGDNTVYD